MAVVVGCFKLFKQLDFILYNVNTWICIGGHYATTFPDVLEYSIALDMFLVDCKHQDLVLQSGELNVCLHLSKQAEFDFGVACVVC